MIHPAGFNNDPAFRFTKGAHHSRCSTPGACSTTATARAASWAARSPRSAPDFNRAVLGVPGMNYSTLLRRSVDFDQYAQVLYANYPNELERPLILSLIQNLWDRGEANGYAHHMTRDPYAEHAAAHGADARGLRRPPGRERDGRGRGPHDQARRPHSRRSIRAATAT